MTWPTHVMFGISALWLLAPIPPEALGYDMGTLAACAAFGALLPDLDASESKSKHLKLLGWSAPIGYLVALGYAIHTL